MATQPGHSHTAPQPHTAAHTSTAAAAESADDNTDWEEFEDFDQEQDRIEKGHATAHNNTNNSSLPAPVDSASTSRSSSTPSTNHSSASASPLSVTPTHSHITGAGSDRLRLTPSPAAPSRPSPPPAIDFFGSVGIASSGYQEPVRLQSKVKPHTSAPPLPSPVLTAAQRADVMRDYGLDDVGADVASWDDGLELDIATNGGNGGAGEEGGRIKRGKNSDRKKKLGAVVMDDV